MGVASLKELTQKTGISADNAKFRNKEYTLLIPFSSLDLDPSLRQTVEPLASKGIIKVYLVSPPDVTTNTPLFYIHSSY